MPKDRLEVLETLGWNAPKPCESQPPSTYVSASTERSGNRFGSADAQEIWKRPDPGVSAGEGEGLYAQLRLFQTDGAAHIAANKAAAYAEEQAIPARRLSRRKGAGGAQSQILCKLPTRQEQIRIQCARQRIYPTAACVQYNAGVDGCQGRRQGRHGNQF